MNEQQNKPAGVASSLSASLPAPANPIRAGYKIVLKYLSVVFVFAGIINLLPLLAAPFYPAESAVIVNFVIPAAVFIIFGAALYLLVRKTGAAKLLPGQDTVVVIAAWLVVILSGSIPFMLSGYTFSEAMFESVSGFTTTGLTVTSVAEAPHILLLHRSLISFFGGVGLVLVITGILGGTYGMRLYNAEGHSDRLLPNLIKSARTILVIYVGYILIGFVLYVAFGMPVFDALNHSISAVATSGFCVNTGGIGAYNSLAIEIITVVLMLLGATNFLIHLMLIRGSFKKALGHYETKTTLVVLGIAVPAATMLICIGNATPFGAGIRTAVFETVSILSTSGFMLRDAAAFGAPLMFLLMILANIGGAAGSTSGGIKQARVGLLAASVYWGVRDKFSDSRRVMVNCLNKFGRREAVSAEQVREAVLYVAVYFITLCVGSFIFMLCGAPLGDAFFEFSNVLSNAGMSAGIAVSGASAAVLWTSIIGMFVGRLEFFVIFMCFARIFGDLKTR